MRELTGILSSFDMKKPALAGYSHGEGRRRERAYALRPIPFASFPAGKGEQTGKSTASVRGRRLRKAASFIAGC